MVSKVWYNSMRELGSREVFKRNDSIGAILYIGGSHLVEGMVGDSAEWRNCLIGLNAIHMTS